MPDLNSDTITAIDERVRRGLIAVTQLGEVVARTSTTDALVVFDGSQAAVPCKIGSMSGAYEGDTVGVGKYGRHWIIVTTIHWRGARRLTVANRASRPTTHLTYGDQILQLDTNVEYWWDGSVWIPTGGQYIYSYYRGPLESAGFRIVVSGTNQANVHTAATLQVEPSMEYLLTWSIMMSSGVAGTHFFKSYIKVGGTIKARSGEFAYTGGFVEQRSSGVALPYVTGPSETSVEFELVAHDGSGAAYDVWGDPDRQAYLHVHTAGRKASQVST